MLAVAFGLEAALLAAFLLSARWTEKNGGIPPDPAWQFYAIAALPALAMGVQNAALRRVGAVKVRTTYITGMLTNAAEEAVTWLFGLIAGGEDAPAAFRRGLLFAGIWVGYVTGAAAGVWGQGRIGLRRFWPCRPPASPRSRFGPWSGRWTCRPRRIGR